MSRKMTLVVLMIAVLIVTSLTSSPTHQAYSKQPPSWAMKIIKNTTISGLINEGEEQTVKYLGKGAWGNGINEVWFFAVWRLHRSEGSECSGWKKDLQAHIELGKMGEGVYRMEIYHSWTTLTVAMPYDNTILLETDFLLVLNITACF